MTWLLVNSQQLHKTVPTVRPCELSNCLSNIIRSSLKSFAFNMRIQSVLNPLPLRRRELENQKRPSYPRACQSKRSNSSSRRRRRRLGWLATLGYRLEKPPPLPATWPLHEEYRLNPSVLLPSPPLYPRNRQGRG